IANIANRVRCASSISGPARVRCCWRCSRSCRARVASARISASPRSVVPATTPPRSAYPPPRRSWRATTQQPCQGRPISSLSNPPYVARGGIAGLQAEVRDFDPPRALDGGPDGLDGYRAIAPHAARLLAPDGILVLELGQGQLGPVTSILAAAGLAPVAPWYD